MKTCHTLYSEGPRHVLRDGARLTYGFQALKFMKFIFAQDDSRLRHLHKLDLAMMHMSDATVARLIARILASPLLALDTLIIRYAEDLFSGGCASILRSAIGTLTILKHVAFLRAGHVAAAVLKSIPSKLETVYLGIKAGRDCNVLSTVEPFSRTLETLVFKTGSLPPSHVLLPTLTQRQHFRHLRTLGIVLYDSVMDILGNPSFAEAFPNLTHLQLIPGPDELEYDDLWQGSLSYITAQREQVHAQRSARRSDVPLWPSLVECSGELSGIFALGLDRTLSKLSVWSPIAESALPVLSIVVQDTRPRHLRLSIENVTKKVGSMLRDLHSQCPRRVDLDIKSSHIIDELSVQYVDLDEDRPSPWETVQAALLALLPLPVGLEELHIYLTIPRWFEFPDKVLQVEDCLQPWDQSRPCDCSALFLPFKNRVSEELPSLVLLCEASYLDGREWRDLGQKDEIEDPYEDIPRSSDFDHYGDSD